MFGPGYWGEAYFGPEYWPPLSLEEASGGGSGVGRLQRAAFSTRRYRQFRQIPDTEAERIEEILREVPEKALRRAVNALEGFYTETTAEPVETASQDVTEAIQGAVMETTGHEVTKEQIDDIRRELGALRVILEWWWEEEEIAILLLSM